MTSTRANLQFQAAGFSEQGPRPENQDAFVADQLEQTGLVALADGMGGEKSGRVAADTALSTLLSSGPIDTVDEAKRAVRDADLAIRRLAEDSPDQHGGMGCALGLLSATNGGDGSGWIAAHVGDVRILSRSPDGLVRLETRDHTPAFARWEAGEITLDEIPDSAGANRLQRAVGRGGEADVVWMPAGPGWTWLLISDGVYKAMRLDELADAMSAGTVGEICAAIREKVHARGPDDNYTAVAVRALGGSAPPPPALDPETTQPMTQAPVRTESRSSSSFLPVALALIAIGLGGFALWSSAADDPDAVPRSEVEALRAEVDSLRAAVSSVGDPFGPAVPQTIPGDSGTTPPAP